MAREQGFEERVSHALDRGQRQGYLKPADLDVILTSEDFDEAAFDLFLDLARQMNIDIREEAPPDAEEESAPDLDSFRLYLREIGRYPLLTPEEELRYGRDMREGTTPHNRDEARRKLIVSNLRLVVKLARSYGAHGLPFPDVVEEGNLGLIAAVERFDYRRGFRFSTYGAWWIKQAMARGVANQSRTVRIPFHVIQLVNRFLATETRLRLRLGHAPSMEEVAQEIGQPLAKLNRVRHLIHSIKNLDYESSWEAMGSLAETELAEPPEDLEAQVDRLFEFERLNRLLGRLSKREEFVLRVRYGFDDGAAHSLAHTGDRLGVSRERVRQIEKVALTKLKRYVELAEKGARWDEIL
jgi:RNA polymerase sigma factor (sigma-70 family)